MKLDPPPPRPVVAILGGGFSGAATAFHLARARVAAEIVVVEPREALGQGLAYSTTEPAHRINVPAAKMSLITDEPDHFIAWLASPAGPTLSSGTATLRGDLFPQRAVFGAYVGYHLEPFLRDGSIRHVRAAAVSVARAGAAYDLTLSDGSRLRADFLVIGMSHPQPGLPAELRPLAGSPRLVADPYDNDRVAAIGPADEVLIVGTGLTSADVVASLERRGFRGRITALSRHGLRSRGHGLGPRETDADFAAAPAKGALALLRRVRAAIAADAGRGFTWHAVIDQLRTDGTAAWLALDDPGRARIVRHLRAFWDVHRFRVAPQVAEVLDRWIARGQLAYVAARLVGAIEVGDGILVSFRPRGGGELVSKRFDTVVVTTGPSHGQILRTNPPLKALAELGLVRSDPLGLGISVREGCRVVDAAGTPSQTLFVSGPLARGHVGELMGLPEVTGHAEAVAKLLCAELDARSGGPVSASAAL